MTQVSQPTYLFHITDFSNLDSIIKTGGMLSKNEIDNRKFGYTDLAYDTLQDRRSRTMVHCGPGGCLHDYVPFFFCIKPPMLYTISRGNIEGRSQSSVVYLISTAQKVKDRNINFVFSDGHAIMAMTDFYDDLDDLNQIDWDVMTSKWWRDTPEDPDRKRRRQAEFLIHKFFPWDLVDEIAVMDDRVAQQAQSLLQGTEHPPAVHVRYNWYY